MGWDEREIRERGQWLDMELVRSCSPGCPIAWVFPSDDRIELHLPSGSSLVFTRGFDGDRPTYDVIGLNARGARRGAPWSADEAEALFGAAAQVAALASTSGPDAATAWWQQRAEDEGGGDDSIPF